MGRLASRSAVGGQSSPWQVNYGYGPGGELLAVHDSVQGQRRYSLDAAGRITSVEGDTATERYSYDPAGNITNAQWYTPNTDAATQGQRSYQGSLLVQAGRDRYEYDTVGRLVGRSRALLSGGTKQWRFTWNSLNQLTTATTPDGHRWTYRYDALNRRVSKTHHDLAGQVVETYRFTWDGPTLVEQTHTTASASTTTTWEHEGFTPIAQTIQVGERSQAQVDAEFAAIITDLVGTPIRLLDTNGATTWTNQASTWGATDANTAMPLRFAGQYHDTETGLFYNLNRYYNPDTGRYVNADPLGLAPSPNPHTYVTNPTTAIDPLGLNETHGLHQNGANTRMAGVRATGAAGEAAAGIVKNTTRIPSASGMAAYRIPDELNSSVLGEVKNVSHLNYTSQLRDFAAYAKQEGLTFTLYTRSSTTFSSSLQAEIHAGRIVLDTTRLGR